MLVVTGILRRGAHPRYTVDPNRKTHPASYFSIGTQGHGALPAGVLVSQGAVGAVEKFLEKGAAKQKMEVGPIHPPKTNILKFLNLKIWTALGTGKASYKPPTLE